MRRSDEDLMFSVKEGNSAAFETLTKRHYTNTLNFIYRFVNNRTLAEDLVSRNVFAPLAQRTDLSTACEIYHFPLSHRKERLFEADC